VRKTEKRDIQKLMKLMDQLGYKTTPEALDLNITLYGEAVFVEEIDGEVIGCLAYHILPQFHSVDKHMRIVCLVVDQLHRSKGYGKKMLKEAERIAKAEGCKMVELTSSTHRIKSGAHAFYLGFGYQANEETVYFRKKIDLIPI